MDWSSYQDTHAMAASTRELDDIEEGPEDYNSGLFQVASSSVTGLAPQSSLSGPSRKRQRRGFLCDRPGCSKSFTERRSLKRHQRESTCSGSVVREFACSFCSCQFVREETRKRHEDERHHGLRREDSCAKPISKTVGNPSIWTAQSRRDDTHGAFRAAGEPAVDQQAHEVSLRLEDKADDSHDSLECVPDPDHDAGCRGLQSDASSARTSSRHDSILELARLDSHPAIDVSQGEKSHPGTSTDDAEAETARVFLTLPRIHLEDGTEIAGADTGAHASDAGTWVSEFMDFVADNADWCQACLPQEDPAIFEEVDGADNVSISSRNSASSVRSMLQRMRSRKPRGMVQPGGVSSSSHSVLRNCLYCSQPWEAEEKALREHLDVHIKELKFDDRWYCDICQISFVHQDDLARHQRIAAQQGCCALEKGHGGDCEGYACGLAFKHTQSCTGHHPPSAASVAFSDHERLKYRQLLLRLVQLSSMQSQAAAIHTMHWKLRFFSTSSLPSQLRRRHSARSMVSGYFSFRSEPPTTSGEMEDLRLHLAGTKLSGSAVAVSRVLVRKSFERETQNHLSRAVSRNDCAAVASLLDAGTVPSFGVLRDVVTTCTRDMLTTVLKHGNTRVPNLADNMLGLVIAYGSRFGSPATVDLVRLVLPYLEDLSAIHIDDRMSLYWSVGRSALGAFPLYVALRHNDLNTAELLLRNGAIPEYYAACGLLILYRLNTETMDSRLKALRLLIRYRLDVDCEGPPSSVRDFGSTQPVLQRSFAALYRPFARMCLEASKNPNSQALCDEMRKFPYRGMLIMNYLCGGEAAMAEVERSLGDLTAARCRHVLDGNFDQVDPA